MNAKSPKIMAVQNMLFMVPLEGDEISYSMIYDELKKTEDFYGAERLLRRETNMEKPLSIRIQECKDRVISAINQSECRRLY